MVLSQLSTAVTNSWGNLETERVIWGSYFLLGVSVAGPCCIRAVLRDNTCGRVNRLLHGNQDVKGKRQEGAQIPVSSSMPYFQGHGLFCLDPDS